MSSTEEHEQEQELKHFGFIEEIGAKLVVILSNIYGFLYDNSYCLKTSIDSVETKVVSVLGQLTEKLTDVSEDTLVFLDDKFDEYAPSFLKDVVDQLGSKVTETISLLEEFFEPMVEKTKALLEEGFSAIESLVGKGIEIIDTLQSVLEKDSADLYNQAIETITNLVGGIPIVGQIIESVSSWIKDINGAIDNVTTAASDLVSQVLDKTKSVVGNIPIIGSTAESIITYLADKASEVIESTTSSASDLANSVLDTIKSVLVSIPIVGSIIQSMITSSTQTETTDAAAAEDSGLIGDLVSSAEDVINEVAETTTDAIETVTDVVDTTTSASDGLVGTLVSAAEDAVNEVEETTTDVVSEVVETTTEADTDTTADEDTTTTTSSSGGLFGAIVSAAESVVETASDVVDETQSTVDDTTSKITSLLGV